VKETKELKIRFYVDGACSGNPGAMGVGVVAYFGNIKKTFSFFEGEGTNNRAELLAVIRAFPEISVSNFTGIISAFKNLYQLLNGKFEGRDIRIFKGAIKKFEISSSLEFFLLLRNFIRISQRLLRICGYQVLELFNLNSLEVLKRYLDTFRLSKSYLKEVLLKKKKFEILPLEAKFVILSLTFEILNNYDEFINLVNHQRLRVSKGFIFKDWVGKSI